MERERLRQERLKQWGPRRQELEVARLAEERAKFFDEAAQRREARAPLRWGGSAHLHQWPQAKGYR